MLKVCGERGNQPAVFPPPNPAELGCYMTPEGLLHDTLVVAHTPCGGLSGTVPHDRSIIGASQSAACHGKLVNLHGPITRDQGVDRLVNPPLFFTVLLV